jgi:hypothetical protein
MRDFVSKYQLGFFPVHEAPSVGFESLAPFRKTRPRRGQRNVVEYWVASHHEPSRDV